MPRLPRFAENIDYGDRQHGRRPTLGEVLHTRAKDSIPGAISDDELIKYFRLRKPARSSMADFQEWKRRLQSLRGRYVDIEAHLDSWSHRDAANYARKLVGVYGPPNEISERQAYWINTSPFSEIYVKNESIPHNFPTSHMDFVYSSIVVEVPKGKIATLAGVSGSIIIDRLKMQVTARCGNLIKNAITLGFVQDVVAGIVPVTGAKSEYAKRIKNNLIPSWYKNAMKER